MGHYVALVLTVADEGSSYDDVIEGLKESLQEKFPRYMDYAYSLTEEEARKESDCIVSLASVKKFHAWLSEFETDVEKTYEALGDSLWMKGIASLGDLLKAAKTDELVASYLGDLGMIAQRDFCNENAFWCQTDEGLKARDVLEALNAGGANAVVGKLDTADSPKTVYLVKIGYHS